MTQRKATSLLFPTALVLLGGSYVLLVVSLLVADVLYCSADHLRAMASRPEIHYAVGLTLASCTLAALLSVLVGIPLGYILARWRFPLRWLVDALVEIPVVLPPLVVGIQITYAVPAVVLAQFSVAGAFAVRTLRVTFEQISPRFEQVALTLGSSPAQAFWRITLPQARQGILAAFTIAWARSLGEFGPILVFAGSTRLRTEVLSTSVFLELSTGSLENAVAVSLLMVALALIVLIALRLQGIAPHLKA
jgi:molybdate transport system permease protein